MPDENKPKVTPPLTTPTPVPAPAPAKEEVVNPDLWEVIGKSNGTETSAMEIEGGVVLRVSSMHGEALVLVLDHVVGEAGLELDPDSFRAKTVS